MIKVISLEAKLVFIKELQSYKEIRKVFTFINIVFLFCSKL